MRRIAARHSSGSDFQCRDSVDPTAIMPPAAHCARTRIPVVLVRVGSFASSDDHQGRVRAAFMPRCQSSDHWLVGGVASGKSLVAQQFATLGAAVLDADRAGPRSALNCRERRSGGRERWGGQIFGPDGQIDRPSAGRIVFARRPRRGRRELAVIWRQLTHPSHRRIAERQAQAAGRSRTRRMVLDAPLLLEAGWDKFCDKIVFVEAPREVTACSGREARMERGGI